MASAATALPSAVEAACFAPCDAGLRVLLDFGDLRFVLAGPLLRLFERLAERVDLAAHLADLVLHVALGRTRGRAGQAERYDNGCCN